MTPGFAVGALWALWAASWIAAALWADRSAARPPAREEFAYRAATIGGALLVFGGDLVDHGAPRIWTVEAAVAWALVAVAALGLAFTWWARLHLGRLWSSSVTKKADHRVVDTGPYALVRHPIYTGLILAIFATAALKGDAIAIAGAVLMTFGFWLKARLEERFLRQELGPAYDDYRRKTPMLTPFGSKSR